MKGLWIGESDGDCLLQSLLDPFVKARGGFTEEVMLYGGTILRLPPQRQQLSLKVHSKNSRTVR
jgi:hypothetical protein